MEQAALARHFTVGLVWVGGGGRESPLEDAGLDHLLEMALHELAGIEVELVGQPRRGAPVAAAELADHGSERLLARALAKLSDEIPQPGVQPLPPIRRLLPPIRALLPPIQHLLPPIGGCGRAQPWCQGVVALRSTRVRIRRGLRLQ